MDFVTPIEPVVAASAPRDDERAPRGAPHAVGAARIGGGERPRPEARGERGWHSALSGSTPLYVVADGVGGGAMAARASRELVHRLHERSMAARSTPERSAMRCFAPTAKSGGASRARPTTQARRRWRSARDRDAAVALVDRLGRRLPRLPGGRGRRARATSDRRRHLRALERSPAARRLARRSGADGGQRRSSVPNVGRVALGAARCSCW